jgi:hypothetical protein
VLKEASKATINADFNVFEELMEIPGHR